MMLSNRSFPSLTIWVAFMVASARHDAGRVKTVVSGVGVLVVTVVFRLTRAGSG